MAGWNVDRATLVVGMRALREVAAADGRFEARERRLIEAVARALGAAGVDPPRLEELAPITPEEVAASVPDPIVRERIVQAQIVMSLIDGDPDERELEVVRRFARGLGVDEPRVANLRQLVGHHDLILRLDLNRRSRMTRDAVAHAYREHGLRGAWASIVPFVAPTLGHDAALAARYRALGALPEGTFGRAYFDHMTERGFTFPGEPGGFPEVFIKHDCCHVLGGYDTDPTGECEVVAFICGFMKADPFWYLFMVLVHMHLGIETFTNNPLGKDAFDPDRVLAALARGHDVKSDLYEPGYDWWPLFPRPLDEVRRELGIRVERGAPALSSA